MYSVFSNHLILRHHWCKHVPVDKIDLRTVLESYADSGTYEPHLFLPDYDNEDADDPSYFLCVKPGLHKLVKWASDNILTHILHDSYKTRNVKIRILTGMLNNLVIDGTIDKTLSMYYHDVFVKNIHDLTMDLTQEELPFLVTRGCYPRRCNT